MKVVAPFFLVLALLIGFSSPAASPRLEPVRLFGNDYVSLDAWGRQRGWQVRWLQRERMAELSGRGGRMIFTVHSRTAQINGINVALSFPVALHRGALHVAPVDLQTGIHPVLYPPENGAQGIRTICIDPGHGGRDPGNLDAGTKEKQLSLQLAGEVATLLRQAGYRVVMTRTSDRFVDLPERAEMANRSRADLFVSLHLNSSTARSVRGAEIYCMTPQGATSTNAEGKGSGARSYPGNLNNSKNMVLAYQIQRSLTRSLGIEDRGVRRARFNVLREVRMPAVLVEAGYMSHATEGRKLQEAAYRRQLARAIVDGIQGYRQVVQSETVAKR